MPIEGASPEQRSVMEEILAGIGSERIARVVLGRFEPVQEGDLLVSGPTGAEIAVETSRDDLRATFDAELLAQAFVRRARAEGLPAVAWFATGDGGRTMEHVPPEVDPLDPTELEAMRAATYAGAAAGGARLASFETLQPQGSAVALRVSLDEPHAFLRESSVALLQVVAEWRERLDGIYGELGDGQEEPALTIGWFRGGGFHRTRPDVACCAPSLSFGVPVGWQPPPCPIFG